MADKDDFQTFDLIEEITRNDGTTYYEVGNIMMNGRAEKAAIKNLIKSVRILQLNIPRSSISQVRTSTSGKNGRSPLDQFLTLLKWFWKLITSANIRKSYFDGKN